MLEVFDVFIIVVLMLNNDDQYWLCDILLVMCVLDSILLFLEKGNIIIVELIIVFKMMDDFVKLVIENLEFIIGEDICLVYCLECVLLGKILEELVYNNCIIGGVIKVCIEVGKYVYCIFV